MLEGDGGEEKRVRRREGGQERKEERGKEREGGRMGMKGKGRKEEVTRKLMLRLLPYLPLPPPPQERIAHGPPEPDGEREAEFQRNLQYMKDIILRIVQARREGKGAEELPFIDALLQSGVPEEQVS